MDPIPKSAIFGAGWPAIPDLAGARLLAMQYQLERSQWWPPEELRDRQLYQLSILLRHARRTVPYYFEILPDVGPQKPLTHDAWLKIPLLTRQDVLHKKNLLVSNSIPPSHGQVREVSSSGSTGRPVVTLKTELEGFYWRSITLREHLWHRRDFSGNLAVIRSLNMLAPDVPARQPGWGSSTDPVYDMGSISLLDIGTATEQQAQWLTRENPDYLLTYPTNLRELIRQVERRPDKLKEVRTFGESLPDGLRENVREAWGIKLVDMYSAQEIGYMGLQCPDHAHYHTQPEHVVVEVLRENGTPCQAGEVGRVVVTNLHNFAMPLIRYEILDYAEVGAPCPCGRGLPVLKRILGRTRNLLTLPDGSRHMPKTTGATVRASQVAPVEQIQVIQHSVEMVEIKLAVARKLQASEEQSVIGIFQEALGHPFKIELTCVDHIPRSSGGKFEDFISHVAPDAVRA